MPAVSQDPFWQTSDKRTIRLWLGDCRKVLKKMWSQSVHSIITSPPYWSMRDYEGGESMIGLEQSSQEYVDAMVETFAEAHRVLRDDGTLWLNLGDTYNQNVRSDKSGKSVKQGSNRGTNEFTKRRTAAELPSGNLVGLPWRVALALQKWGWRLRQDIIWHKPSPMPESVETRCTKAHEYVFMFSKQQKYYYDNVAILEPGVDGGSKNKRSVWTVASQGYDGAHFAAYPPKLIEPMVLASTSEGGCCIRCKTPWTRIVEKIEQTRERPNEYVKRNPKDKQTLHNTAPNTAAGVEYKTRGWQQKCSCEATETIPCTILDPFLGSGTTACVAVKNGRRCWGIDLSEEYLKNCAVVRIEGTLLSVPALASLTGKTAKKHKIVGSILSES